MDSKAFKEYLKKNYPQTSSFTSGVVFFIVDSLAILLCFSIGFLIVNTIRTDLIRFKSFVRYGVYIPVYILSFIIAGLYPGVLISPSEEIKRFFVSLCIGSLFIIFDIIIDPINTPEFKKYLLTYSSEKAIFLAFVLTIPIGTILLPVFREISRHLFSHFSFFGIPVAIYTSGNGADFLITRLQNNKYLSYRPAVIFDESATEETNKLGIPVFPINSPAIKIVHDYNIKVAIICETKSDNTSLMSEYRYIISVPKVSSFLTHTHSIKDFAGIIGFASIHNLTFKANRFLKRFVDVFLILLFSPLLILLFLFISIGVKFSSKGPVFYGHPRIGQNNKPFKCWKFRTMYKNSKEQLEELLRTDPVRREEWEKNRKLSDDPRVTKFGKFLRKTSLDELPQLINILLGQMSLVGPRPVTEPELQKYYSEYRDFVLSVKPGLTGMWQISGRSDTDYEERIMYDTYYIQNWSIWLDIWILIKTVWVVLIGKGAY